MPELSSRGGGASPELAPLTPPREADRELLETILADRGLGAEPAPVDWSAYPVSLAEALGRWLDGRFRLPETGLEAIGWVLLGLVAAALLAGLVVLVWRLTRYLLSRHGPGDEPVEGAPEPGESVRLPRDPAAWRERFEADLAAGRLEAGLEALWWWVASTLLGVELPDSLTTGELLERSRRRDLRRPLTDLDALLYGPESPQADRIRSLFARLEAGIGREVFGDAG